MSAVEIRVIDRGVMDALDKLDTPLQRKSAQKAVKAAAKFLKPKVVAATPKGKTGNMRRSVQYRAARREKPGEFVRFNPRIAPHRHLVVQGTKERFTKRTHAFRGRMTPNPIPATVADQYGEQALSIAEAILVKELGL